MFHRFVVAIVVVPLAIVFIVLAVANRAATPFTLDPFNSGNPGLTVEWPLFIYLFLALILGVIVGSIVTWFRQGRYRRLARERTQEAERLRRTVADRPAAGTSLVSTDDV